MTKSLNDLPEKSLDLVIITAHGTPLSIRFGNNIETEILKITKENFSKIKQAFKALADNATIVLNSCLTAAKKNGLADRLLKILPRGTNLIAANNPIDAGGGELTYSP